jgi:uncharacterized protein (TIGR00106 family)
MPKVFADVTIVPLGTGTTSLSDYVAAAEQVLKQYPTVRYRLNPMSTTLEGELDSILEIIRKMHEAPFNAGAQRVSTTIRIDERRDKETSLEHKVQVVQEKAQL